MIKVYEDWEKVDVSVNSTLQIRPDSKLKSDKEIIKAVQDALAPILPHPQVHLVLLGTQEGSDG